LSRHRRARLLPRLRPPKPAASKPGKAPAAQTTAAKPAATKSVATKAATKPAADVTPVDRCESTSRPARRLKQKKPRRRQWHHACSEGGEQEDRSAVKASVPAKPAKTEAVAAAPALAKEPTGKKAVKAEIEEAVEQARKGGQGKRRQTRPLHG
jgi:hypothetical protein